jgi:lambda repressor-like predicted transcriptional regulator
VTKALNDFLNQQCQDKGLTLRSLSINSGLSPSTVHNIIRREKHPALLSLNRLADYLGVKREHLWQLAGLLGDMDYGQTTISDPQLRFHFARVDKLTEAERSLIVGIVKVVLTFLDKSKDPDFAEYIHRKYPGVEEDVITMVRDVLERPLNVPH